MASRLQRPTVCLDHLPRDVTFAVCLFLSSTGLIQTATLSKFFCATIEKFVAQAQTLCLEEKEDWADVADLGTRIVVRQGSQQFISDSWLLSAAALPRGLRLIMAQSRHLRILSIGRLLNSSLCWGNSLRSRKSTHVCGSTPAGEIGPGEKKSCSGDLLALLIHANIASFSRLCGATDTIPTSATPAIAAVLVTCPHLESFAAPRIGDLDMLRPLAQKRPPLSAVDFSACRSTKEVKLFLSSCLPGEPSPGLLRLPLKTAEPHVPLGRQQGGSSDRIRRRPCFVS